MIHSILRDQNIQFRSYLGRYLKQKRESLNLSVGDVAMRAKVSEASYRILEAGRSKTTFEVIESLFPVLHLDLQELFEITQISKVAMANDIAKELSRNYPE